ncbi:hypothetical protein NFI96_030647 [Prochilodus magdalenae]|nr:hypothetical protein NFI96_030647 [Prochilodus magdalenae]
MGYRVSLYQLMRDDVSVFVRNGTDIRELEECLHAYSAASSAKVNWGKSGALLCGPWRDTEPAQLPGGLGWSTVGLKVLGVHLGTAGSVRKNWQDILASVTRRLTCWKWLLPQKSYRDRVLYIFCSGQHWLKAAVLYLLTHERGQGLIDLESRVAAFRLKAVQRLLYRPDLPWRETAHVLLRKSWQYGA